MFDQNQQPRILITRLSHIGDCILTLPMVNAIRAAFPGAFIAWAVEPPSHKLISLNPAVNEIVTVPKNWMKRPANWFALRKTLKNLQFDCSIDPQGITKSAMLGWLSGAPHRIGIRGRWGRELSPLLNNRMVETVCPHLVDRSLELLNPLKISSPQVQFQLEPREQADRYVVDFLRANRIDQPIAVINPGASWGSKRWVNDRYGSVAAYLREQCSVVPVVSWAGNYELDLATEIVQQSRGTAILAPTTSLEQFAALCRHAKMFVGCDTGPMHISVAVGTPCVGLYGPTRPEESGAYGSLNVAVQKWYQEGSCRERRGATNDAMQDITIDDVCRACDELLSNLSRNQRRSA